MTSAGFIRCETYTKRNRLRCQRCNIAARPSEASDEGGQSQGVSGGSSRGRGDYGSGDGIANVGRRGSHQAVDDSIGVADLVYSRSINSNRWREGLAGFQLIER